MILAFAPHVGPLGWIAGAVIFVGAIVATVVLLDRSR